MSFRKTKFIEDYHKWRDLSFWKETSDNDGIYDVRYDLFEIDSFVAGYFINLIESDFKDVDHTIRVVGKHLYDLLKRAKKLRNVLDESDKKCIDRYIEYMELLMNLYLNYRRLLHDRGKI